MMRTAMVALVLGLVSAACGGSSTDTTAGETESEPTTTQPPAAPTTTTPAPTTTRPTPNTTTTSPAEAIQVPVTPVVGVLDPYSPGGGDLFPPGSVEAHWYQWNGLYVVLYRGFDAVAGGEICAGNSIFFEGLGWDMITNSPHIGAADDICVGTAKIAEAPSGVFACDTLLYYVTEIPRDAEGTLFGTLEIGDGEWNGQTSEALTDLANTPEFEPGLSGYELAASNVDPGGVVTCG